MPQSTFTLVPNPLGMHRLVDRKSAAARPPMTSKQAQKLYKAETRPVYRSKAEQRRFEREEQERIRKELDKEKQTSRARAARERKKAKEQEAIEERRRRHLPTIDVSSSQDTIARFARGNGTHKKRDSAGSEVAPRRDHASPLSRSVSASRDSAPGTRNTSREPTETEADKQDPEPESPQSDQNAEQPKPKESVTPDQQPPKTGPESYETHNSTTEEGASCHQGPRTSAPNIPGSGSGAVVVQRTEATSGPKKLPAHSQPAYKSQSAPAGSGEKVDQPERTKDLAKPQYPKPPTPAQPERASSEPGRPSAPQPRKALQDIPTNRLNNVPAPRPPLGAPRKTLKLPPSQPTQKQPPISDSRSMPPPPLKKPRLAPPALASSGQWGAPKFLPGHTNTSTTPLPASPARNPRPDNIPQKPQVPETLPPEPDAPPSSTQAFIFSHLDDLFPTPSQEARELQGDDPPPAPAPRLVAPRSPVFLTPRRPAAREPPKTAPPTRPNPSIPSLNGCEQQKEDDESSLPFFSTQDFILSSQDLRDLGPSPGGTAAAAAAPSLASSKPNVPRPAVAPVSKPQIADGPRRSFGRVGATVAGSRPNPAQHQAPHHSNCALVSTEARHDKRNSSRPGALGSCSEASRSRPSTLLTSGNTSCGSPRFQGPSAGAVNSTPSMVRSPCVPHNPIDRPGSRITPTGSSTGGQVPSPPAAANSKPDVGRLQKQPQPALPPSSDSPPTRRFFTSSNREALYLAADRSRRTFEAEERAREAERRREQESKQRAQQRAAESTRKPTEETENQRRETENPDSRGAEKEPTPETAEDLEALAQLLADEVEASEDDEQQHSYGWTGNNPISPCETVNQGAAMPDGNARNTVNLSQETDYGDLDGISEGDLDGISDEDLDGMVGDEMDWGRREPGIYTQVVEQSRDFMEVIEEVMGDYHLMDDYNSTDYYDF